jgi:hypothetical protein
MKRGARLLHSLPGREVMGVFLVLCLLVAVLASVVIAAAWKVEGKRPA